MKKKEGQTKKKLCKLKRVLGLRDYLQIYETGNL